MITKSLSTKKGHSIRNISTTPWIGLTVHSQAEWKAKENWFHLPTYRLQTPIEYTTRGRHIVFRSFHIQIIPKISNILQKCTLTKLYLCKTYYLPMSTLSLQIPLPLQPQPSIMGRLIQQGEKGSHLPWDVREDLQEPISRSETGRQYTKVNTLNMRLSCEKLQRR